MDPLEIGPPWDGTTIELVNSTRATSQRQRREEETWGGGRESGSGGDEAAEEVEQLVFNLFFFCFVIIGFILTEEAGQLAHASVRRRPRRVTLELDGGRLSAKIC